MERVLTGKSRVVVGGFDTLATVYDRFQHVKRPDGTKHYYETGWVIHRGRKYKVNRYFKSGMWHQLGDSKAIRVV